MPALGETRIRERPANSAMGAPRAGDRQMQFTIEVEREEDGRWIAEIAEIPGAMTYGTSRGEAIARVEALALRVLAERIEAGEQPVEPIRITFAAA